VSCSSKGKVRSGIRVVGFWRSTGAVNRGIAYRAFLEGEKTMREEVKFAAPHEALEIQFP